jgi:phenylacetate-coenzyme A ligase PaaK-like adenylate-forming protein
MTITPLDRHIAAVTGTTRAERDAIEAYQLSRLRGTVTRAKRSGRFYRRHFTDVDPAAIDSLEKLSLLPFTLPSDIAAAPYDFLCVSPRDVSRIVTVSTSGTTGRPKRVFFSPEDQESTVDFFHHGMSTFTSPEDTVMIGMPGKTPGSVGDLLAQGLSRLGCRVVPYGPIMDFDDAIATLRREGVTVLVGIPCQALSLARRMMQRGIKHTMHSVLLSADYIPAPAASIVHEAWGAGLYPHFGMTETGYGGAVACRAHAGMHIREADLLFEIIDPLSQTPLKDGETGELVVTTLTRKAMPLIRYRTGDLARITSQTCPCGSMVRRLERVFGRIHSGVSLRSGGHVSPHGLDDALWADPSVLSWSAAVEHTPEGESLCVTVEAEPFDEVRLLDAVKRAVVIPQDSPPPRIVVTHGRADFLTTGTLKRTIAVR